MTTALNRLSDGTLELTINIPWIRAKQEYEKVLEELIKETEIKGFRKGKAPRGLIEKNVDKQKIYEEVLKKLLPLVYIEAIKEHNLKPIVNPQIRVISLEENKDWQIQATIAEMPVIKLGKYQEEIRKELATERIIVPGKQQEEKEDKKLAKIFQTLLKTVQLTLPRLLTEEEVNRKLARLVDQTSKLGLTVEQYLSSINKNSQQLRTEYTQQVEETLKLEFILNKIADEERINISEEEIAKAIAAVSNEADRQQLEKPEQKVYLKRILCKQKVIEKLLAM